MIKADISKGVVKLTCSGLIPTICDDITSLIHAIINSMEDDEMKTIFKQTFLMGIDDGIVFDVSKEEMEYLREKNEDAIRFGEEKKLPEPDDLKEALEALKKIQGLLGSDLD